MSQHDYVIANDTAANVRADINTALAAIVSNNSGASAPATMYANQFWYDTTNDILKFRAEANDIWISIGKLDQTLDQFFPIVAGVEVVATGTELNFVDGVTSAIQTQINAKAPLTGAGTSGTWGISITGDAATTDGKSFGTFTAAGGIAYATSTTALAATAAGTSGQVLLSGGAGAPTFGSAIIAGTVVASTSGTAITFTGIPSWATRITMMFNETSTSGTSLKLVQIGSTTFTTSGYASSSSLLTTGINTQQSTAGFVLSQQVAAEVSSGAFTLVNYDGNIWVSTHAVRNNNPGNSFGAGIVTLSGVLDRIRVTTVSGTDTFDAGSINILWE